MTYEELINSLSQFKNSNPEEYYQLRSRMYSEELSDNLYMDIVSYSSQMEWNLTEEAIQKMILFLESKSDCNLTYWENIENAYNSLR